MQQSSQLRLSRFVPVCNTTKDSDCDTDIRDSHLSAKHRNWAKLQVKKCVSCPISYPGDGQRHVEVLAPLQPEAPGPGAGQRHGVGAHSSSTQLQRCFNVRAEFLEQKPRQLQETRDGSESRERR